MSASRCAKAANDQDEEETMSGPSPVTGETYPEVKDAPQLDGARCRCGPTFGTSSAPYSLDSINAMLRAAHDAKMGHAVAGSSTEEDEWGDPSSSSRSTLAGVFRSCNLWPAKGQVILHHAHHELARRARSPRVEAQGAFRRFPSKRSWCGSSSCLPPSMATTETSHRAIRWSSSAPRCDEPHPHHASLQDQEHHML